MSKRRHILWVDGSAALIAGVIVLLISGWLSDWYRLPRELLVLIGVVNLVYASYSLSLARRAERPLALIGLLVVANSIWALVCFALATNYRESASLFGLAHFIGEGLFVGGLAVLEWRWRDLLRVA